MLWFVVLACTQMENETGEEATVDPNIDSDGDGYLDVEEIAEGTDPNDSADVIYVGGWPYNRHKDQIESLGWDSPPTEGVVAPEYVAVDQFGDQVNLYDFAGRGVPVVLDVGTPTCGPCKALAAYLSTDDQDELIWNEDGEHYPWWKPEYSELYNRVQNEEIYWITILFTDNLDSPVTMETSSAWEHDYPNDKVPVLADSELVLRHYLDIQSYPAISVLDENMVFTAFNNGSPVEALQHLFAD